MRRSTAYRPDVSWPRNHKVRYGVREERDGKMRFREDAFLSVCHGQRLVRPHTGSCGVWVLIQSTLHSAEWAERGTTKGNQVVPGALAPRCEMEIALSAT